MKAYISRLEYTDFWTIDFRHDFKWLIYSIHRCIHILGNLNTI